MGSGSNPPVTVTANSNPWTFDVNGGFGLPQGSYISEPANPGGFPGNALSLHPDVGSGIDSDQQLLIYPTGGVDANHLHLTSGNLWNTELFLGNDNLYVKLGNTGNVEIRADDSTGNAAAWTFDREGVLTAPGDISATGNISAGNIGVSGGITCRIVATDPAPLSNLTALPGVS